MAHKTRINGTAYDIVGGMTRVNGTSYSVKNGKVLINGTGYDISFILPPAALDIWSGSTLGNEITCITYANGYWVVGGNYSDGNKNGARIAYATSLDGSWTTKDMWGGNSSVINGIAYGNGYWVVAGKRENSGDTFAYIGYSTSLDGTWTTKNLWSTSSGTDEITCLTYANGYFVVGGIRYSSRTYYNRISYVATPSSSWKTKVLWSGTSSSNYIYSIAYINNYWVVCGVSGRVARIAYAADILDSFTITTIWTSESTNSQNGAHSITYGNGYWVVGGTFVTQNPFRVIAQIAYSTSLSGNWETKELWSESYNTDYHRTTINSITFGNGYFVAGGVLTDSKYYARIAYATEPSSDWAIKDLWSYNDPDNNIKCVAYANEYFLAGGQKIMSSINQSAHLSYADSPENFISE